MDKPVQRVDIPAKVTGGAGLRPRYAPAGDAARSSRPAAELRCETRTNRCRNIEKLTGVVKVIRDGNFLAVVAYREFQAIKAMQALSRAARWEEQETLPTSAHLQEYLSRLPSQTR